jgi:hypothetical protein
MRMLLRAALILLPIAAVAQVPPPTPPTEVDQALRARVSEFFQYHVEAKFTKAFELVAEDTREYYFAAQKTQFKSFKIDGITYSDQFTKAVVTVSCERMWRMSPRFPEVQITQPMSTTWRIENGKWFWYRDANNETSLTPMGQSDPKAIGKPNGGPLPLPPDLSHDTMKKRAEELLKKSSISKTEVVLATSHPSSEQVVFHNGQPGSVLLSVDASAKPAGFSAVLDKKEARAGEDVVLKIQYDPADQNSAPPPFVVRVVVAPFNQAFAIAVKFAG